VKLADISGTKKVYLKAKIEEITGESKILGTSIMASVTLRRVKRLELIQ